MLKLETRTDGFRVLAENGHMLASIQTRVADEAAPKTMPDDVFDKLTASQGQKAALEARDQYAKDRKDGVTFYRDLPRAECQITSAVGPLSVAVLEEMLSSLPVK